MQVDVANILNMLNVVKEFSHNLISGLQNL